VHNWENFRYQPWHVDLNSLPSIDPIESNEEDVQNPLVDFVDFRENEWEILCGLYKNKYMNYNEYEMLGHRDRNHAHNWNTNFVDEVTCNCDIHIISEMRKWNSLCTNLHGNITPLKVLVLSKYKH